MKLKTPCEFKRKSIKSGLQPKARYTRHTMKLKIILLVLIALLLNACSSHHSSQDGPPSRYVDVSHVPNATPQKLPRSAYGNPASYTVFGKRYYVMKTEQGYNQRGIASWYGTKFHGQLTSSREPYNMLAMTAASKTLPIPCFVKVTNLRNGKWVIVKVNDRGPFVSNRIIDLSYAAARKLDYTNTGTAPVQVTALTPWLSSAPDLPLKTNFGRPHLYVQLGAFSQRSNALALQARLQHIISQPVHVSNLNSLYRVQVGPLNNNETADVKALLDQQGYGEAVMVVS